MRRNLVLCRICSRNLCRNERDCRGRKSSKGEGGSKRESGSKIYKEVNINGRINTEIDEVDLVNQIIYEDKSS